MKYLFTFLFFLLAGHSQAQNCSWQDLGGPMDMQGAELDANGNGRIFLTYHRPLQPRPVGVRCLDESGNILWDRWIAAPSPQTYTWGIGAEPLSNGGCVVLTSWAPPGYDQMHALLLDDQGNEVWTRLYQRAFVPYLHEHLVDYLEHPAGGYVMLSYAEDSSFAITRLDGNGVPRWCRRISYGPQLHSPRKLLVDPDGSLTAQGILDGNDGWVLRLDSSGNAAISSRWSGLFGYRMVRSSNGVLVSGRAGGFPGAMELDQAGAMVWARSYDMASSGSLFGRSMGTSSGGFLFTTHNGQDSLQVLRTDASGVPQAMWGREGQYDYLGRTGFVQLSGDTVGYYREWAPSLLWVHERLVRSWQGMDFSCEMGAVAVPPSTPLAITIDPTLPLVQPDSMKTWFSYTSQLPLPPTCEISVDLAVGPLRPGFSANLQGWAFGIGETSGPVSAVMKLEPYMTVNTSSPPGGVLAGDSITWTNLPPLGFSDSHHFEVQVALPPDTALIGQVAGLSFHASQDSLEVDLLNNSVMRNRLITSGWDPNDKLVLPEQVYDPLVDSLLHYTIRFQNTGTDTAFNVVIVDSLPAEVSVGSFRMGGASHPCTYDLTTQGVLTFTFNNILLPDSGTNEPASHGLVTFTVRPDNGLALGTTISNEAGIYFDFNPPVITPPAEVVYGIVNAVPEEMAGDGLGLYPVPVRETLTVVLPPGHAAQEVLVYTADGRLLERRGGQLAGGRVQVDVQHLPQGLYLLQVVDREGRRLVARFLKE